MEEKEYIVFDRRETVLQSWVKDILTFGFIILCIYISRASTWWTFAMGSLFLLFAWAKAASMLGKRRRKLIGKKEALEWANSLEDV